MSDFSVLLSSVGNNKENRKEDVLRVKSALSENNFFNMISIAEPHGYITRELDTGIKGFQKFKGLREDGYLLPGGETEKALFAERKEMAVPVPTIKPSVSIEQRKKSILDEKESADFNMAANSNAISNKPWYALHAFSEVEQYKNIIDKEAKKAGVNPEMVKAIVYLETTQGYYDRLGGGLNKTVRPMNVHSDFWKDLGHSREDLENPEKNIKAGVDLLSRIMKKMPDTDVAKVATIYNNLGARKVSDYGARIKQLMKDRPWQEK